VVIELTKQIKLVRPEAKSIFPYSNSLFIDDEVKAMVDAGAGGRAYAQIPLDEVTLLLLTHEHFDHINGLSFFPKATIMVGEEGAWAFRDRAQYILSSGLQHWEELMGSPRETDWERAMNLPADIPDKPGFQAIEVVGVFKDGHVFNTGETSFTAVHTPGHSPGHYAFFFPKESILYAGDLDSTPQGPWYGGEFCDLDEIIMSVNKLISLKPNILVSSHRSVMDSRVEELMKAYIDIVLQREEKIFQYLVERRTIDDITNQGFFKEWEKETQHGIFRHKMMIVKHLNRLIKNGLVIKDQGKYIKV
jgi:glyoxylase-like metal-dependent hydrolase (beta-lactamase superfamily II)